VNVPFLDLGAAYREIQSEIDESVHRVLSSGYYILGPEVEAFEKEFAEYCTVNETVSVANGLDALHLALLAVGIEPGDEVIVPSNTFIATWLAVSKCGAIPVPVEPNGSTNNIEAAEIKAAITTKTKAIIPVHLYGQPCDLDPILALAKEHRLVVVEDAAQAHGACYKGKRIGGHGDVAAWSFYPGKNLGALGDGGAITTNNSEIAERVRMLRNYGSKIKYVHELQGVNSRLDPLQAAVLRVKLKHLDQWNTRRKAIAEYYRTRLTCIDLEVPHVPIWCDPVWHLFVVKSACRDSLQQHFGSAGIGTLIHYPIPPHKQQAYEQLFQGSSFPIAERLASECLSLPIGPHMNQASIDLIDHTLSSWRRNE
jgi:dTDP-4-amino-4,6-dideoxygalactose transaminase